MSTDSTRVHMLKEYGSRGGLKRAKNLTAKQRSEIARKGALAKWAKWKAANADKAEGVAA